ncbi:hypothetical protein HYDPIDRAFT_27218 [Hydnomerulius pinastri MD-312]|nr:hypothetical protein HYDPIDRAFT_27218 [Hydnomerulius pinastri MD-312]
MPPRTRRQRRDQPSEDEPVATNNGVEEEIVENDENAENVAISDENSMIEEENDENTPINDENSFSQPPPLRSFAPAHRSSSVLALRTPLSHSHVSEDTALRDITDQFFHPPSPSPLRISKPLKRPAPNTIEPPRRPKKPKSLAYPADPPGWLHSQPSSSLPPSSPLPPSTSNFDHARATDAIFGHTTSARYEYELASTPTKAPDSDPFGFFAVERALKAKRAAAPAPLPRKPPPSPSPRVSGLKSPPRSTVITSGPSRPPSFSSFAHLEEPVPTNNEDLDDLYLDEPIAGPSRPLVPAAPLLAPQPVEPLADRHTTYSQETFPDPLRTPRKRKRRVSPTPGEDSAEDEADIPSSPSPVKMSVGAGSSRRPSGRVQSHTRAPQVTRVQTKARGKQPALRSTGQLSSAKRVKTSHQHIPTPSSTPSSHRPSESSAPPTPIARRRSARQAAAGAKTRLKDSSSDVEDVGRMKLRTRSVKVNIEGKAKPSSSSRPKPASKAKTAAKSPSKPKATVRPAKRGRPKGKASTTYTKGKKKARPLEDVLGMSDDTRERYEVERRERLDYFKRLDGYQMQKENLYVV